MFCNNSTDFREFFGNISKGDLIELKPEMMLIDPKGPVLVLDADNKKGLYEIMYTLNSYVISVGRIDIKGIVSENGRSS